VAEEVIEQVMGKSALYNNKQILYLSKFLSITAEGALVTSLLEFIVVAETFKISHI
jgi:hypothetical protein